MGLVNKAGQELMGNRSLNLIDFVSGGYVSRYKCMAHNSRLFWSSDAVVLAWVNTFQIL